MESKGAAATHRILVVDDDELIQHLFRGILTTPYRSAAASPAAVDAATAPLNAQITSAPFEIDSALQGDEAVDKVRRALNEGRRYSVAFVDIRMPPGLDGIETITQLWRLDPDIYVVIHSAYLDDSWEAIQAKLRRPGQFFVLRKPLDTLEGLRLAQALSHMWWLHHACKQDHTTIHQLGKQLDAVTTLLDRRSATSQTAHMRFSRALEQDLRRALQAGELSIHYQPLVEITSRRVSSLEALVRWKHPKLGFIAPAEFIPLAEQTGLIVPLGEFVLKTVCQQIVSWRQQSVPVVRVAVNLSPVQLEHEPVQEFVGRILRETGLPPQLLALELTETSLVKNAQAHWQGLQQLRDEGVDLEIDDFGTGYSSLSYLKQLPVDTLKIDRSFIHKLDSSGADEAIVIAILALARGLHLRVVAEGVETPAQLTVLARHGCQVAQGFYFSKPLPADECLELLLEVDQRSSFTETVRLKSTDAVRRIAHLST